MRIPYAPADPVNASPEMEAIYDRIRQRRQPRPLIPLDLALLHNPNIADGFSTLLGAIRTQSSLPKAVMELAICYVAFLNGAIFEWNAHAPLALKAGVSRDALSALLRGDVTNSGIFSEQQIEVLLFTFQSTRSVEVKDDIMQMLKHRWNDQQIVELTMTVAAYNMVSRFLVALDVAESNGNDMEVPV